MFETSLDWKISKTLIDAGGLGPRVYICFPRYHDKWRLMREYQEYLLSQGRQIVIMQPNRKNLGVQLTSYADIFVDHDILTPESYARAERIWNEYWKSRQTNRLKGE